MSNYVIYRTISFPEYPEDGRKTTVRYAETLPVAIKLASKWLESGAIVGDNHEQGKVTISQEVRIEWVGDSDSEHRLVAHMTLEVA